MVTSGGGGAGEHHDQKRWWSSRVRPWLRQEREFEIAERGSETDLVIEGYKSGGWVVVFLFLGLKHKKDYERSETRRRRKKRVASDVIEIRERKL